MEKPVCGEGEEKQGKRKAEDRVWRQEESEVEGGRREQRGQRLVSRETSSASGLITFPYGKQRIPALTRCFPQQCY